MKIGQTPEHIAAAAADKARSAPATAASGAVATTAAADEASAKVALSTTATSLTGSSASSSADFDADKVATVTHAIDTGSYRVNAHTIADKLLANARELLTKTAQ